MSVEYQFLADGLYSIEQIEEICLKLPNVTKEEIERTISESLQIIDLKYKQLPEEFIDLSGIKILEATIRGVSSGDLDIVGAYSKLLNRIRSELVFSESLTLTGSFEERETVQESGYSDRVFVNIRAGQYFFNYSPNASKIEMDDKYRLKVFKQMTKRISLPIKVKRKIGSFYLQHSEGGELTTKGNRTGMNPTGFSCELMNETSESVMAKMALFLSEFSSGRIFSYAWRLFHSSPQGDKDVSESAKAAYDLAVKNQFPADEYQLSLSFHIQGLSGLESARQWCVQRDSLYSTICYFESDEGVAGNLTVLGEQKGYQVKLHFNRPVDIHKFETRLGLKFEEVDLTA